MKLLLDFLPIALFFVTFKLADAHKAEAAALATRHLGALAAGGAIGPEQAPVMLATVVVVAATALQVAWLKASRRRVDTMLWASLALVVVMGGLTLWLQSEAFIKWKPTLLYWAMAAGFAIARLAFGVNAIRKMLGEQLALPERVWERLNWVWAAFFAAMGALNLWVAQTFPTDVWVDFKLFGILGLMVVFTLAQGVWLSRHLPGDDPPPPVADPAPPAQRP